MYVCSMYVCVVIIVAAWVYDSIIHLGVNRRGRDFHCIVGVLGESSHTL